MGSQPCAVCHCDDSSQDERAHCQKPPSDSAWHEEQVCNAVVKVLQPPVTKQQNIVAPLPQVSVQTKVPIPKQPGVGEPDLSPAAEDSTQPTELALVFHLAGGVDLGLELAEAQGPSGSRLVVADVDPQSPLACIVEGCPPIVAGDVIAKVNGQRDSAANLRVALEQGAAIGGQLRLAVLPRPAQFEVQLRRVDGSKLGLLVAMDKADPDRIAVRAVRAEGIVPDWNASNACFRVVAGDWVTQVNGRSRGAQEMYSDFTACDDAELRMRIVTSPRQAV